MDSIDVRLLAVFDQIYRTRSVSAAAEALDLGQPAVSVALAKLLARRAGARLETLVIDEGFGSQDNKGRERLVEAITSVQTEFKHILVITHIQELKDLFPVQIEITKTPQGSVWAIA